METKIHNWPAASETAWWLVVLLFIISVAIQSEEQEHSFQSMASSTEPQTPGMTTTDYSSPTYYLAGPRITKQRWNFPLMRPYSLRKDTIGHFESIDPIHETTAALEGRLLHCRWHFCILYQQPMQGRDHLNIQINTTIQKR